MRDKLAQCLLCTLFLGVVHAQTPADAPAFIAADVHVTAKNDTNIAFGQLRGDQWEMRGQPLLTLISRAYGMDAERIFGGPRWLEMDKFDVIAKVPPGTKNEAVPPMLKKLLVERFGLEARPDTRSLPAFTLTAGKGKPKMQPGSGETRINIQPGSAPMRQVLTGKSYTMANFAGILRSLGNPLISAQVVDKTGLEGTWDFELEFTPPNQMAAAGGDAISIFEAVEKLGLKLEQQSVPTPVLVIERANQVPTENAPGVAEKMDPPAPPPTLDVSTIKPAAPTQNRGYGFSIRSDPQGMVFDGRNVKVLNLLQLAYDLQPDRIIGLPVSADGQAYDMMIRAIGQSGLISTRTIGPLMQQLAKERFNLKAHIEDRSIDAYRLVAVKPKMAKADPENRASCKEGPAPGAKDPREQTPGRSRLITCRNITMAEFVERLQNLNGGYVRTPIVDATKLEGMWDFALNFTPPPPSSLPGYVPPAPPPPGAAPAAGPAPLGAADPSDALTLFEAITSQLGLKLEVEKRMLPVLVIEHIDDGPTEN